MYITEAILLGLALAMDCFAVSITSGAIVKHIVLRPMLTMILRSASFREQWSWPDGMSARSSAVFWLP